MSKLTQQESEIAFHLHEALHEFKRKSRVHANVSYHVREAKRLLDKVVNEPAKR